MENKLYRKLLNLYIVFLLVQSAQKFVLAFLNSAVRFSRPQMYHPSYCSSEFEKLGVLFLLTYCYTYNINITQKTIKHNLPICCKVIYNFSIPSIAKAPCSVPATKNCPFGATVKVTIRLLNRSL